MSDGERTTSEAVPSRQKQEEQTSEAEPSPKQEAPTPAPQQEQESEAENPFHLKEDPYRYVEYGAKMRVILKEHAEANFGVADTVVNWPYLTTEEIVSLAVNTVILEETYDRALALDPPEELIPIHQKYLEAHRLIKGAMPVLRKGLDEADETLINTATDRITQSSQIMEDATQELNSFVDSLMELLEQ